MKINIYVKGGKKPFLSEVKKIVKVSSKIITYLGESMKHKEVRSKLELFIYADLEGQTDCFKGAPNAKSAESIKLSNVKLQL